VFWHRTPRTSAGPWPGTAYPLGATYDGAGTNFALFSEVADEVELCLFDDGGDAKAIETRVRLPEEAGPLVTVHAGQVDEGRAVLPHRARQLVHGRVGQDLDAVAEDRADHQALAVEEELRADRARSAVDDQRLVVPGT